MKRKLGFTLVELLVVIAIIAILASIAVPKVSQHLLRARVVKAESEIRGADLALMGMMSNAQRSDFNQLFLKNDTVTPPIARPRDIEEALAATANAENIYTVYNDIFYDILRRGKEAGNVVNTPGEWTWTFGSVTYRAKIDTSVLSKLGTGGLELLQDPWGQQYRFVMGPLPKDYPAGKFPALRCYRGEGYIYDTGEGSGVPGDPPKDGLGLAGFPAPFDKPFYIYSFGEDSESNQGGTNPPSKPAADAATIGRVYGGGDDINNWDTKSGWMDLY